MAQAKEADADLAKGRYRGPLHGLPWGAKDLLAVKGYPTTWGAGGFEKQTFDTDATVVTRLDESGAVLVAKLTLGSLAMNDTWFDGRTRNPWNLTQGSSGSSAGSAAATAAGCVAFAIGSETLGSISSPSTRCGVTGYRPTFGFVPRTGGSLSLFWRAFFFRLQSRSAPSSIGGLGKPQFGPQPGRRSPRVNFHLRRV
jgi:Asp-tRNA(Asn)/Glu-tRNA(Gln) amidotransferase A subunit family amidase